ncbi:flagellar export protein FliJ [Alkalibacter mobilis]|uniref:flagellar export protein FliJ n=1 Tax=Alkalibacter mobilis TaxID=2787712 RepID=UPI00189DC954|nr:flagellar export protein FliJ [Alkalibacter mobilis]MBF7096320.1 flagellar export protein FliJ [Alkalibacter mobilis]
MKNYRFKMEKVLEYKSNVEKLKVEDYAKINLKLLEEKEQLEDLEAAYNTENRKKIHDIKHMKMHSLYKEKLRNQLNAQENRINEMTDRLECARGNLIEARKDRKIMENLKDKDRIKYDKMIRESEQKELDDLTVMKHR